MEATPIPSYTRVDTSGIRFYKRDDDYYISMTSFLKEVLPTSPHLIDWYKKFGERTEDMLRERSAYGTMCHQLYADYLLGKDVYSLAREYSEEIIESNCLTLASFPSWVQEARKSCLSFQCWVDEYEYEPQYIEGCFGSKIEGVRIAGSIDHIGLARTTKGRDKQLIALDAKHGKGFYDDNAWQLRGYKILFEDTTSNQIERLYNWRPTAWRKTPTYQFKHQKEDTSGVHYMAAMFYHLHQGRSYSISNIAGPIQIGKEAQYRREEVNVC